MKVKEKLGSHSTLAVCARLPLASYISTGLLVGTLLAGCDGAAVTITPGNETEQSSSQGSSSSAPITCDTPFEHRQYARLESTQLANSLAGALGASAFELEHAEFAGGNPLPIPADLAMEFSRSSTSIEYTEIFTQLAELYIKHARCDLSNSDCHNSFLAINGKLLLRRVLTAEETRHWQNQFTIDAKLALVAFLSQEEVREIEYAQQPALVNLATRMSLMLNDSTPDIVLLNKALDGSLADPVVRAQEAERLINISNNFYRAIKGFYSQWLGVREYALNSSAAEETYKVAFAQTSQLYQPTFNGSFDDLLLNTHTIVPPTQNQFYNDANITTHGELPFVIAPMSNDDTLLELAIRPGLFTKAGFLTAYDSASMRGWKMRQALFCGMSSPSVSAHLDESYGRIRTQYTQEREDAGFELPRSLLIERYLDIAQEHDQELCSTCHEQYLPLGRTLNTFDVDGSIQAHFTLADQSTQAIHTTGLINLLTPNRALFAFDDISDLLSQAAQTPLAGQCFVSHWLSYANQLSPAEDINRSPDNCRPESVYTQFENNGGDLKQLLIDIAASNWLAE